MKKLIIVGAGSAAREVLQIVKDINQFHNEYNILGFLCDIPSDIEKLTNSEYHVIGTIQDWIPAEDEYFTIAIADPKGRKKVAELLIEKKAKFVNIIHPTAKISDYSVLGEGLILYPTASIGVNCHIGDFVYLQRTHISHDVKIGSFSTISSLCGILGKVNIHENVFIGCHSCIIPEIIIGKNAYIGAGSVVIDHIPEDVTVFGNPAKIVQNSTLNETPLIRYNNIFYESLSLPESVDLTGITLQNCSSWDSVGHLHLIAQIEDTFQILLETTDILNFNSYLEGINILKKHDIIINEEEKND